jgi:hypothetical protein
MHPRQLFRIFANEFIKALRLYFAPVIWIVRLVKRIIKAV